MEEEDALKIQEFDAIPSAEEFTTQIEPTNVPSVFKGCVTSWKAFGRWNPSSGGLDYLEGLLGSSTVEAMLSSSPPIFYGDIRSHEMVPLAFSSFVGFCKDIYQNNKENHVCCSEPEMHGLNRSLKEQDNSQAKDGSQQIYLAQVPILNNDNEERVQLGCLREDIDTPVFLGTKKMSSINLWMNSAPARSSTHYDPHHNLLCVVSGSKQVVLWPPSSCPCLYPMPLHGEASNHSAVSIKKPDLSVHPRAEHSMDYSQTVVLHAGDALFIPEGWYHQVDSDRLTIAVNFWWQSDFMSSLQEHMDAYYLRSLMKRLTVKQMNQMLCNTSGFASRRLNNRLSGQTYCINDSTREKLNQGIDLHELEPFVLQPLHQLITLVHDHVKASDPASASESVSALVEIGEFKRSARADLHHLEDDPVASILWALQPLALQKVFLAMAQHFPRTLESLILHLLSPVGAEVLTRKFEEMDQLVVEEDRNEFYRIIYGVFDNPLVAMDALLNGKESFSFQAFKNVLDQYLGVKWDGPTNKME